MKKLLYLPVFTLIILGALQLTGCKKETEVQDKASQESSQIVSQSKVKPVTGETDAGSGSTSRVVIGNAFDASGRLEIKIWAEYADGQYPTAEVSVDPSYVLIGGGGRVTNFSNTNTGVNALLTAAYPKNDGTFSTFVASSKEHLIPHTHRVWAYAIGMRLFDIGANPIPEATIESLMSITAVTSASAGHPAAYAFMPPGNIKLSGGAKVNWSNPGNLLVKSSSNFSDWEAFSKDHLQGSSATITSYVLSINPNIPQFGVLETSGYRRTVTTFNGTQGHNLMSTTSIPGGGWLLSGVGGESTYNGVGRMLFALYPDSPTSAVVSDKDHSQVDNGRLHGLILAIRKQ